MRIVLQRVSEASVTVEGSRIAKIEKGLLALIGYLNTDTEEIINYMMDKVINLRVFEDSNGKMNLSLKDIDGELLIVPNFTLYGDCRKGRRPSYSYAAEVEQARIIFEKTKTISNSYYNKVNYGQFQADMKVSILNDGPVTLLLDSDKNF